MSINSFFSQFFCACITRNALHIALVVGTLLNLVNQGKAGCG